MVTDMTSDFESITSSNYAFREEGGRRYESPEMSVTVGFGVQGDFGMQTDGQVP